MLRTAVAGCFVAVLLAAPFALAHHSIASYDLVHGTILDGAVAAFAWENPHVHILLNVTAEDGITIEHWTIELESPSILRRLGWEKDTLKEGDRISVTGGRAKNGSFNLRAARVEVPGGRVLPALPPPEN
ncbi:MAG TPA: DUF6152 family protein [Bryobacteraceae bacterium]|jgi:hypothetical protein